MASAIPCGAPGYDDDKEFGNNITHSLAQTSQRLRSYSCRSLEVKARRQGRAFYSVAGFRALGESEFAASSHAPSFGIFRKDQTSIAHRGISRFGVRATRAPE